MESPDYEMTHDFEEENELFQSGYIKGYHDAIMRCPDIVQHKDCKMILELTGIEQIVLLGLLEDISQWDNVNEVYSIQARNAIKDIIQKLGGTYFGTMITGSK